MLNKILIQISGNEFFQRLLERNIDKSQSLMGIGSGTDVASSGERAVIGMLQKMYNPPYSIFDVGSNKGQFLKLILENLLTEDFDIRCFEPGRETFRQLVENFEPDHRIVLNAIGLGKEKGETVLYYDTPGSGLASLTKRRLSHFNINFNQFEKVKIDTVDNYCRKNDIERIHLLKIDVEGHELDVLFGAANMIRDKSIGMISFEFGGCNIDTRSFFQDFYYFFNNFNMSMFRITPSGYLYPINSYKEIFEQFRTTNFLAIQESL